MKFDYSKENEQRIIEKLTELDALHNCPRCGHPHFQLADGVSLISLQDNISNLSLGGRAIPVATTVCKKCGFLSQHALGILGMVDFLEEKTKDDISSVKE